MITEAQFRQIDARLYSGLPAAPWEYAAARGDAFYRLVDGHGRIIGRVELPGAQGARTAAFIAYTRFDLIVLLHEVTCCWDRIAALEAQLATRRERWARRCVPAVPALSVLPTLNPALS